MSLEKSKYAPPNVLFPSGSLSGKKVPIYLPVEYFDALKELGKHRNPPLSLNAMLNIAVCSFLRRKGDSR
jgi:hypothetical protein